jgi:hypothetical protein
MRTMPWLCLLATLPLLGGGSAGAHWIPDIAILPESSIPAMLLQCSRSTPTAGERGWQPTADDIVTLEQALPTALRDQPETQGPRHSGGPDWSRVPDGWRRQYVGIVRGGRLFVYGNFIPNAAEPRGAPDDFALTPILVCDGGPAFFGVEYDVEARRFTHIAFNGPA